MNFSYGIIIIVGVLAAISIGFIAMDPGKIIEPRSVGEEKVTVCTMQWDPMCGVDGETYGNMCMLNAAGVELSHRFECGVDEPKVIPRTEPEPVACTMEWNPMCGVDGTTYGNPCGLDASGVELDYEGECGIQEPEPTPESLPVPAIVSIPVGVAVPGCEGTNECYLPYEITVTKGTTISWMNADSAAHTVSSGTVESGLSGVFDSSLFMSGSVYEFTFNDAGTYDYFCMVHPWMTGIVNVN